MKYIIFLFLVLFASLSGKGEGTEELNSNSVQSTDLYLCNDFATHCTSSAGLRSQFATYDDTQSASDADRLYFATLNGNEVVYLGFQGSGLSNPSNPARHIVFRIKNMAGTIVFTEQNLPTSGTGYISTFSQALSGPNQLITTPPTNGYDAIVFTPPSPGTYYIEFTVRRNDNNNIYVGHFDLALFDITVGNTVTQLAKPGRLYSKSWQFYESSDFYGKNYVISDDSIVTSAQFSGMSGGHWNQYCNQSGCGNNPANWISTRKSLYQQQALYPQYKIFLNEPDPLLFPAATTLGQIIAPLPYGVQNCLTGHVVFHVTVNKPGNVEITLTFPSPYQPRTLNQAVVSGVNLFDWDGLDGTTPTGLVVPNNINIQYTVKYINGLTNLPLYDVEGNTSGFTIALVSPAGTTPAVFWDDTNIPGGVNNSNLPGCTSPPGCHSWANSGGGWGDLNTVNTWWYNVSTTTAPATVVEFRGPLSLAILQEPPQAFCANTGGHYFSVTPDVNTDVYHWSYSPPAGVTISQATPGSPSVTLSFGAGASSGVLQVYGTNTNCAMSSTPTSLAITINPLPSPSLTGPSSACSGQTGVVYSTDPGKSSYQWLVSAGGTITAGGSPISNTVTVTWNNTGAQTVSVNYQNPTTLCTAATPTILNVTVNSHPTPSLAGSTLVCVGTSGVVYTTEPGKTNYIWSVSPGGTITAGGNSTSNTATVTWNSAGIQTITVLYTNPVTLCSAITPTPLTVTVNNLPSPTFQSGSASVCLGVPGNIYTTEPGMTNYIWTITGGIFTSGGTSTSNSATVTWNSTGIHLISVNYTYPFSSCTAPNPATMTVTVKPLPAPAVISGNNSVCLGVPGNIYFTQPGMLNYYWSVSGGTITAGGDMASDFITVTWNNEGEQSIGINYTDPSTNCSAAAPAFYYVTVKPLPVPTFLAGENPACITEPGNVYTTQPGMNNYFWSVTGGTITGGGAFSDQSAVITWNMVGTQSISVNYTDPVTQCTSAAPTLMDVTVNPLPIPTFVSGENLVCNGSTGKIYATQSGMLNYSWSITGGVITDGGTSSSNTATVTWNSTGIQNISVSYTDPVTLCTAATPATYAVTVKPLPLPTITGPGAACLNTTGPQYTTEAGMSNYAWVVPDATVVPGVTPDTINVVWHSLGLHTITVIYTGLNGCNPETATEKSVFVNILPTPTLSGLTTVCTGIPTTYTTEAGMQSYSWTVSSGGTIINGGSATDNAITVSWNAPGIQHVSVNYFLGTGCTAAIPTAISVTVNPSTPPIIQQTPAGQICSTSSATYTTQPGMSGYLWAISPGGSITSSSNSNVIVVKWNTVGVQWVSVNFTNPSLCTASAPTLFDVTVNPLPVTQIVAGPEPECESIAHAFLTSADPECTFNWTISPVNFGEVTAGQGLNEVMITWLSPGQADISVTSTNNTTGCTSSSGYQTTIYPRTIPAFKPCFDIVTTPNAKKFNLRGATPFIAGQGVFSGYRVSLNSATGLYEFDPSGATPGEYPITYTYTNIHGCPASPPTVSITVQNNVFSCGGDLTDVRDGKKYKTSTFGGRCWITENLTFGNVIGDGQPSTDNCINEKYCRQSDASCTIYGGLYQWNELMQYGNTSANQGICPPEWHVPSETEWQLLLAGLGTGVTPPDGVAGSFLKDSYLTGGFHALIYGLLYFDDVWAFTAGNPAGAMYWTSTSNGSGRAIARGVNSVNPSTANYPGSFSDAFSVRCVKDY